MASFDELAEICGLNKRGRKLLAQALSWRSIEQRRLAFTGDRIAELVIANHVVQTQPDQADVWGSQANEMGSNFGFSRTARRLGIDRLITSASEALQQRPYAQAHTLESVIGAVYRARGYRGAERFVLVEHVQRYQYWILFNSAVETLNSVCLRRFQTEPVFTTSNAPHTNKKDAVALVMGHAIGLGIAVSREAAIEMAARDAVYQLVEWFGPEMMPTVSHFQEWLQASYPNPWWTYRSRDREAWQQISAGRVRAYSISLSHERWGTFELEARLLENREHEFVVRTTEFEATYFFTTGEKEWSVKRRC